MQFSFEDCLDGLKDRKNKLICCDGTVLSDYEQFKFGEALAYPKRRGKDYDSHVIHFIHEESCPRFDQLSSWYGKPLEMEPGILLGHCLNRDLKMWRVPNHAGIEPLGENA